MKQFLPLLHQLIGLLELVRERGAVNDNVLDPLVAGQASPGCHITVEVGHLVLDAVELVV